jgi:acylphosphatase
VVHGQVQAVGFREAAVRRAHELGALGWVRNGEDGDVLVHAEGEEAAVEGLVEFLEKGPRGAQVDGIEIERVKPEGHEQFAIRGVSAGVFVVRSTRRARATSTCGSRSTGRCAPGRCRRSPRWTRR